MKRLFPFALLILLILAPSVFSQEEDEEVIEGRIDEIIRTNVPQPEGSKVTLDERTGTLIVTNTPTNLKKIEAIIEVVDKPPTQVLIEIKFIEIAETALHDVGIHWPAINIDELRSHIKGGSVTGETDFGGRSAHRTGFDAFASEGLELDVSGVWKADAYNYNLILRALQQTGMAEVLGAPRVTTLNNQEAIIEIVTERTFITAGSDWTVARWEYLTTSAPYGPDLATSYYESVPNDLEQAQYGTMLTVTPEIGEKTITLSLRPELKDFVEIDAYGYATFGRRDIITRVLIEDGETVIMGGLISETDYVTQTKVPLLGDLPLIGRLFRRDIKERAKKNLLIFVTCHLLTPSGEKLVEVTKSD